MNYIDVYARVNRNYTDTAVTWINLFNEMDNPGYFLLMYDIDKDQWFDNWYPNLSDAEASARELFGIQKNEWKTLDQLQSDAQNLPPKKI